MEPKPGRGRGGRLRLRRRRLAVSRQPSASAAWGRAWLGVRGALKRGEKCEAHLEGVLERERSVSGVLMDGVPTEPAPPGVCAI